MKRSFLMLSAILLFAFVESFGNYTSASAAGVLFPPDARHIMPVNLGKPMMHPCSRHAPEGVVKFWEPTDEEIGKLETQLVINMESLTQAQSSRPPDGSYGRQYIGIVLRGKRLIYGNFYPSSVSKDQQIHWPVSVCDGGPSLWSIIYNPALNTFADLEFTSTL